MNTTGARPKNRHNRSEENQSDGNEGSDSKEDERNRSNDGENDNSENSHDNDMDPNDGTSLAEQVDAQNKKSASSDGSKRVSPVQFEEREPKKNAGPSGYKPARRYPNRDSLLNRHRDLSQENKRLLGVPSTRNSSLAPLLRDGAGLGSILGDIPDYYTDGGETIFTGKVL